MTNEQAAALLKVTSKYQDLLKLGTHFNAVLADLSKEIAKQELRVLESVARNNATDHEAIAYSTHTTWIDSGAGDIIQTHNAIVAQQKSYNELCNLLVECGVLTKAQINESEARARKAWGSRLPSERAAQAEGK